MSKQQAQLTALVLPATGNEPTGNQNFLKKYLFHWPLFVLSVVVFIAVAYYYMLVTNPTYPISAALKFKTPTSASGGNIAIKDNSIDQLDPITNPVIVENEVEVMQSKKIIYQIVKNLQLWVGYVEPKGLAVTDLYPKSPVFFSFVDSEIHLDPAGDKIEITVKDGKSFSMEDSSGTMKTYQFSHPIHSFFGTWKLDAKDNIGKFVGSTIAITVQDPDLVSDAYQKNIKVELDNKDAPFVDLSMSDQVPARGKDILNSLISIYRENAQLEKSEQTQKILGYISAKVDSLKKDLDQEEQKIEEYKRTQQITDLERQADNYRNEKMVNDQSINTLDEQIRSLEEMDDYLNSPENADKLPPSETILIDAALSNMYNQLSTLQLQREQQLALTPESNPVFIGIKRQIAVLRKDFKERVESVLLNYKASRQQLVAFDSSMKASLQKIPHQQTEYYDMLRERQSKESTYTFLYGKREEINLHFASIIQDTEIVDDAHAGEKKWPKTLIVYALAVVLGLAASVGILYARENLNEKITNRSQIEDKAEVPILGELSYQDAKDPIVVTAGRSRFAVGEQFRVLRTNLYHLHGTSDSGRVTLFTSSVSGEGKSFVSSNLGVTLAYAARKTIILEMDLRKPKISVNFGLSSDHTGLSDYLAGEKKVELSDMIQPSGIPGLDVISRGSIVPNPSELLEKQKLDELINLLKTVYDDIIIDTPPIHLVTDALIISRVAGATLYIIRQGYTHKSELEFIKDINESNRFNKFTIVFNGVKKDSSGYGYGYYNNYSYYNSYTEKQKWNFRNSLKAFFKRF